jgi:serine/tyrosine/threonine adenylyltransferase
VRRCGATNYNLTMQWNNHFYKQFALPERQFLTALTPRALPDAQLMAWSPACAAAIGVSRQDANWLAAMCGGGLPAGAQPCATVYSGHQFGHWAGQLGDGRAMLLGGVNTAQGSFELQLKGSGRTPYSRGADGMAVLRSSIREFLCSEAMAGLGIPTTRALALAASPQGVMRETIETAAVVLRTAPSFVRFGHFEHFAAAGNAAAVQQLVDFVCTHHYPAAAQLPTPEARALAMLEASCQRTAALMAQWQAVGFCHGVMNSDNMSVLGLTLDYGPFGFLDTFDAHHICNHTDQHGRYAYARQPQVAHWNLGCLAQALSCVVADHEALTDCLKGYAESFNRLHVAAFLAKLGLPENTLSGDAFVGNTLQMLHESKADMTAFFRRLSHAARNGQFAACADVCVNPAAFDAWLPSYQAACAALTGNDAPSPDTRSAAMLAVNPKYILRNHLAEVAIRKARDEHDFSEVSTLLALLEHPYNEQPEFEAYAALPPAWAAHLEVSCSS